MQVLHEEKLYDVKVVSERGDKYPMTFPVRTPTRSTPIDSDIHVKDYPQRVPMGADFGPDSTKNPHINGPTATIGGYLEILRLRPNEDDMLISQQP